MDSFIPWDPGKFCKVETRLPLINKHAGNREKRYGRKARLVQRALIKMVHRKTVLGKMVFGKSVPEKWFPGKKIPGKMVFGKKVLGTKNLRKEIPGKMVPRRRSSKKARRKVSSFGFIFVRSELQKSRVIFFLIMFIKQKIPTYFLLLITNMTVKIGANEIFKVTTLGQRKNLMFHGFRII